MTRPFDRPVKRTQTVTLGVPPSTNERLLLAQDRNTGRMRMFGTSKARKYKLGQAQMLCFLQPVPKPREVRVDVVWHMRPDDGGDLDNILKILLDTLKGHGYEDDSQVAELTVSRVRNQRSSQVLVTIHDMTDLRMLRDEYTGHGPKERTGEGQP